MASCNVGDFAAIKHERCEYREKRTGVGGATGSRNDYPVADQTHHPAPCILAARIAERCATVSHTNDIMNDTTGQGKGQAERFIRMVEPLKLSLNASCNRSINAAFDREDVLQTALMTAFSTFHLFQEGTNFRAWMFKHLQNAIWNQHRKAHQRPGSLDAYAEELVARGDFGVLSSEVAYHEMLQHPDRLYDHFDDRIASALLALSLPERTTLLLRSIGDFNYRDIAAIMNIPMGTVMSHLSRAREKMRERIAASFHVGAPAAEPCWEETDQRAVP